MTINERINFLISTIENGNKSAFASKLGTSSGVIGDIIGGRLNKPSFGLLEKLVNTYPHVNATWLLTGEGEMFNNPLEQAEKEKSTQKELSKNNSDQQNLFTDNEFQIVQRFLEIAHDLERTKNVSIREFSDKTGLDYLQFHLYNFGQLRITFDQVINISNNFFINTNWLLTGKGEKFLDDNSIVDISINRLNLLAKNFDFFEKRNRNIANTIYDLSFTSKHSKQKLSSYYNFFNQIDINQISELRNKPLSNLSELDLNIIGLERSFVDRDLLNLFYTEDFNNSKLFFNKVDNIFELRGLKWPTREDFSTEEDFLMALEKLNAYKNSDYNSETNWGKYRIAKLKDILTTEELINEVFRWKFKG